MTHTARLVAVLDACVFYPAPVRDFLLHLANLDMLIPKWTKKIQEEWTRNLLLNRPDIAPSQLAGTVAAMNTAFPDAEISNYLDLIPSLKLPDPNDNHVLAAAIRCKADIIVTTNIRDFPGEYIRKFDIEAQCPDKFIAQLIESNPTLAVLAFKSQVSNLKNPPLDAAAVLSIFKKIGLTTTSHLLSSRV